MSLSIIHSLDWVIDVDNSATTVPNQPAGVFWAVLNRLLIIGQVIVLILSEVGKPMFIETFFASYFPILGRDFGLGALGVIQTLYVSVSVEADLITNYLPQYRGHGPITLRG